MNVPIPRPNEIDGDHPDIDALIDYGCHDTDFPGRFTCIDVGYGLPLPFALPLRIPWLQCVVMMPHQLGRVAGNRAFAHRLLPSSDGLSPQQALDLGHPQDQHEWLAVRERTEAELRLERSGPIVDCLHDNGAGADHVGGGETAPDGADKKVGAEVPGSVMFINGELSKQDDRDRIRHTAANSG